MTLVLLFSLGYGVLMLGMWALYGIDREIDDLFPLPRGDGA